MEVTDAPNQGLVALRYALLLGTSLCANLLCAGYVQAQSPPSASATSTAGVGYLAPPGSTTYNNVAGINTTIAGIVAVSSGADAVSITNAAPITAPFGVAARGPASQVNNQVDGGSITFGQVGIAVDSIGGTSTVLNSGIITRAAGIPAVDVNALAAQLGPTFSGISVLIDRARGQFATIPN